jgi:hypothetical protein
LQTLATFSFQVLRSVLLHAYVLIESRIIGSHVSCRVQESLHEMAAVAEFDDRFHGFVLFKNPVTKREILNHPIATNWELDWQPWRESQCEGLYWISEGARQGLGLPTFYAR